MFSGYGRGRNFGGGMGLGFRGSSPPWPYVGLGRGGLPRCGYYSRGAGLSPYQSPVRAQTGNRPYSAPMSKEEEMDYLKNQAQVIKEQLDNIESRMHDLEGQK